ncbi:hypothetical protein Tco_1384263 [Tanacetum coccineum]
MTEFPQLDSGLVVPVFTQGDDPIACLNKAMAFLSAVYASRFPSTNNQLRTSSNLRNQTTIQDDRVTVQQVQGGKDKVMLVKDTWLGNALSLRGQGTLHDPCIPDSQVAQITILNIAAFKTEDLDAYDSDCDDVSNAKAVLMANLSNYGSYVVSEVPHSEPYHNDIDNQSVHTMQDFGKHFIPQQELFAEQAFWLQTLHPNIDQSDISPVKIEAPRELPKVILVNTSLKKLKYHLGMFDTVVKKWITPDAIKEGE